MFFFASNIGHCDPHGQVSFPDVSLETVMLLPRDVLINRGRMPTHEEAEVRTV